jgi:sn-glycerol 3-phosphate transport system permease protein
MLPVEVRILPTYEIAANIFGPLQWFIDTLHLNSLIQWWVGNDFEIALEWSLLDSYTGLILPLVASATCTFLFRQFF